MIKSVHSASVSGRAAFILFGFLAVANPVACKCKLQVEQVKQSAYYKGRIVTL